MKNRLLIVAPALVLLLDAGPAHATLFDRGSGLIYDDVLNVTWLQNANLAATNKFGVASGIYGDGTMSGLAATSWLAAMNASDYKGFADWRLPSAGPVNGVSYQLTLAFDGSTDIGANITSAHDELAYLFFVELGNRSLFKTDGTVRSGTLGVDYGVSNAGPFSGLAGWPLAYGDFLTGTAVPGQPGSNFLFSVSGGTQSYRGLGYDSFNAWAVRTGDVTPIPEPGTWALLAAGVGALQWAVRRRKAPG